MAALAQNLLDGGKKKQAVIWARKAVQKNPRRIAHRIVLGDALAASGKRGAAIRAYRRALGRAPHNKALKSRLRNLQRQR